MRPSDAIARMLAPLRTRIANMVARAVVELVKDSGKLQTVQLGVLDGETRDDVERVQEYGFTSVPLPGAEAVVVFVGGRRDHGLAVAVDDRRHRKKGLEPGEVALYTDEGDSILLRRGNQIEIRSGLTEISDGGSTDLVALASLVLSRLNDLHAWALTHVHTSAAPGSPTTPALPTAPPLSPTVSPVAASTLKAE